MHDVRGRTRESGALDIETALWSSVVAASVALPLAHVLPWTVSRWLLSAVFATWVALAIIAFVVATRKAALSLARSQRGIRILGMTAGCGIALGALSDLHLGLLRSLGGRTDLIFHIDHRFLLMHSWSILRAGGLGESLAMAGTPVNYHSGPAWFAAAGASLLDAEPHGLLFLVFPAAAMMTILLGVFRILVGLGAAPVSAAAGLAFALTPPWEYIRFVGGTRAAGSALLSGAPDHALAWLSDLLLNPAPLMMLNSRLGLTMIVAAIALFARTGSRSSLLVASMTVALSAAAKPQYAIAGAVLLMAVGVAMNSRTTIPLPFVLASTALSATASVVVGSTLFGQTNLLGRELIEFRLALPHHLRLVKPFLPTEAPFLLAVGIAIALSAGIARASRFERRARILLAIVSAGGLGLWFLLTVLVASLGPAASTWAWNVMQATVPLHLLASATGVAALVEATRRGHRWMHGAITLVIAMGAGVAGWQSFQQSLEPMSGYEAVDAGEVRALLSDIDPERSLILVSDLADPAQDHQRPGRAFYLSAPLGHRFWLTQTTYGHERLTETAQRRDATEAFFTTDWSAWHVWLLSEHGITHVAINDRCAPVWDTEEVLELTMVGSTDTWTIFEVNQRIDGSVEPPRPTAGPVTGLGAPAYGQASCR